MDTALRHRVNAARVAIRQQRSFFRQQLGQVASQWKADDTRVTFADFAISEKIIAELRRSFTADQFFSEESGPMDEVMPVEARYSWVLDPVDGTNNYALGMTSCAISLALLKQGSPAYGLIYDGSTDQLYEGGPGQDLLVDGKKPAAGKRNTDQENQIVALHFPLPPGRASQLAPLLESSRVRSLGSAALHLAYVALGRVDGALDEGIRVWDIAAAVALLKSVNLPIRYLSDDPFPLETFDLQGPRIRYVAGRESFIEAVQNWLG